MGDMTEWMIQSKVRQHLRDQQGSAQCPGCVATAIHLDYESIRTTMNALTRRQLFTPGPCACGAMGLSYGGSARPSP